MNRALDILVVDDDRDNADSMGELLQMDGHRARVVYSGAEAIHAYLKSDFDIAFVDVVMPGLNGVESFMEIRKLRPDAKVFMMSGYSVEELLKQAADNGALGLLSKPLPPEAILEMVQQVGRNGLVVARGQGPAFTRELSLQFSSHGQPCQVIDTAHGLARRGNGSFMILDLQETLIDSVGRYVELRKGNDLPPTLILAQQGGHGQNGNAMADIAVTGILNKPFDPEVLIQKLEAIAA